MLDAETKRRIDTARDVLVGKVPDPKSQVEQITIALIYKFMDDMDQESLAMGGKASFFTGEYEKYSWTSIFDPHLGGFDILSLYSEALTKMSLNPGLPQLFRDIFKNAYLPYRDPETLKLFLKTINEFSYDQSERLGDAFEYLLQVMGSQGEAGQFLTPRHIINFMVQVVDPQKHETILDPACGTGGFLISAFRYILNQNSSDGTTGYANGWSSLGDRLTTDEKKEMMSNFRGYDISPDMVRLARANLYLHGFQQPRIEEYDTLTSEEHWGEMVEVILANPPFMSPKGGIRPHHRFMVQSNRSEVLFVDYIAEHLTPNGRGAVIVPEGIIFQTGKAYKQLRKMLVEDFLIGVISLPSGVFMPYTGVKTSILIFNRVEARRNPSIIFSNVLQIGFSLGAKRTPTDNNDLLPVLNDYRSYYTGGELSSQSWLVTRETVLTGDVILTGNRYKSDRNNRSRRFLSIGEICRITKGSFSSTKTSPGPYRLVLTAADSKTADSFDIEGPSVCVPLISSLGHGKAALHRIHYADGHFALANLLVALQPLNPSEVDAKFLFLVLDARRDAIAGLMQGAANVSMKPESLATFQIPLPPIDMQKKIVVEIEGYQRIIDGARQVVDNWKPNIEFELEEARTESGVKEWEMVKLGDERYFTIESGGTPDSTNELYWNGKYCWATLIDLPKSDHISIIFETNRKITSEGLKNSAAKVIPVDSIIVSTRATIGRVGINKIPLATNQGFKNIILKDKFATENMYIALLVKNLTPKMEALASGGTFKEISKTIFSKLEIPLPPIEIQKKIVSDISRELEIINGNSEIIRLFEEKIKRIMENLWG